MIFDNFTEYIFTTDQGIEINYGINFSPKKIQEFGNKVVVFNYGLVCNIAHWKYQIPFFNSLGYAVVYHDYRFHYKSTSTNKIEDLSFKNIVNDMNGLLNYLNIEKSFHLGHSMGVNISLEFAKCFPEKVLGMILISGTVLAPQDVMFDTNWMDLAQPILQLALEKYPKFFKAIWKTGHRNPLAKTLIHKGGFNTTKVPLDFVEYYLKKIGELDPNVFFALLNEMKNHSIISHLSTIKTPALIMGGDKDQVIPHYLQEILKESLNQSQLYIIKDGSHVPQADFPESVNERILIFIEKCLDNNSYVQATV